MKRDAQRWWFASPVVTLIVGLVIAATLADISHHVYERNQRRLLNLRARDAASVLTEALPDLQTALASAAELAGATDGNVAKFRRLVAPYVAAGPEHEFVDVSLWRLGDLEHGPIAVVGPAPRLATREASAFFAAGESKRKLSVIGFLEAPSLRIGYGYATPTATGGYAAYAESALPADRRSRVAGASAFAGLGYALYLGRSERLSDLLVTNAPDWRLSGRLATVQVPFGDTSLTLEMSSHGSLSGELPEDLPWIILISGVLLAIIAAVGTLRLTQRRRIAERLAGENRRLYAEQRSIAQTLQHALLPERLPETSGLQTAVRYEAGERSVDIGGDWYDVIESPGERLLLVVGDVSGRGLRAATTMASLRYAIRAYAAQDDDPPTILCKLSQLLSVMEDRQFATVLCVEVMAERQEITVTSAGHLPPLLIGPDQAVYVDAEVGLPVGIQRGSTYSSTTVQAPAGATLLAFTDGLVERRGESLDDGLARLARLARDAIGENGSLASLLDTLVADLPDGRAQDDIAIVGLRWMSSPRRRDENGARGGAPGHDVKRAHSFPLDVRSVAAARRFCTQTLDGSAPEVIEAAELMVSELATNSIRHVRSGFELTIVRAAAQIRVEVRDFGGGIPELQLPGPDDLGGRGLRIVEMLSDSWGYTAGSAEGKTVWFTLATPRRKCFAESAQIEAGGTKSTISRQASSSCESASVSRSIVSQASSV